MEIEAQIGYGPRSGPMPECCVWVTVSPRFPGARWVALGLSWLPERAWNRVYPALYRTEVE